VPTRYAAVRLVPERLSADSKLGAPHTYAGYMAFHPDVFSTPVTLTLIFYSENQHTSGYRCREERIFVFAMLFVVSKLRRERDRRRQTDGHTGTMDGQEA